MTTVWPYRSVPQTGVAHLHYLEFDGAAAMIPAADALLTQGERARANHFHFRKDADKFVLAHGFLRAVLASYLGCAPSRVPIMIAPSGKPMLDGALSITFNMSHGDSHVLVAVARTRVGVDVESRRTRLDAAAIARRFFAPDEASAVAAGGERVFRHIWVCKEAFAKAIGEGLRLPLDSCVVADPTGRVARLRTIPPQWGDVQAWSVLSWQANDDSDAIGAVVLEAPQATIISFDGLSSLTRTMNHSLSHDFMSYSGDAR